MSVNLSMLSKALSRTLHNKSGTSYAPGTSYGGSIPGTNITKGAGLKNLASKGRRGDTKIRRVKGKPSHVNATEASVIDKLGPLGEAWVQSIGSGTTNPSTGLKEYGAWRPSQGKWGIFGSTRKSKVADSKKASASARRKQYEDFLSKNKSWDPASLERSSVSEHTVDPDGGGGGLEMHMGLGNLGAWATGGAEGAFDNMMITTGGTDYSNAGISQKSFDKYVDEYDPRFEEEAIANYKRKEEGVSRETAAAEFGNLTASTQLAAQQGFASAGDFATDLAEESRVGDAALENEQNKADAVSAVRDVKDDYNQEFWNQMNNWDMAVNA